MNGTLAQLISLTSFGNTYLKTGKVPTDLLSNNSTYQFCNTVDFRILKKAFLSHKTKEIVIASNPNQWFNELKSQSCQHLRLYYEFNEPDKSPDSPKNHQTAGFVGGGGTWLIETVFSDYSDFWVSKWESNDQEVADDRVWSVNYAKVLQKQPICNMQFEHEQTKDNLNNILIKIAEFAYQNELTHWGDLFTDSKTLLNSDHPEREYNHQDLIDRESYSLTARQLIFTAGSAFVFGGMGSWNDIGFDKEDDYMTYDQLSVALYEAINKAIIAGVNSY